MSETNTETPQATPSVDHDNTPSNEPQSRGRRRLVLGATAAAVLSAFGFGVKKMVDDQTEYKARLEASPHMTVDPKLFRAAEQMGSEEVGNIDALFKDAKVQEFKYRPGYWFKDMDEITMLNRLNTENLERGKLNAGDIIFVDKTVNGIERTIHFITDFGTENKLFDATHERTTHAVAHYRTGYDSQQKIEGVRISGAADLFGVNAVDLSAQKNGVLSIRLIGITGENGGHPNSAEAGADLFLGTETRDANGKLTGMSNKNIFRILPLSQIEPEQEKSAPSTLSAKPPLIF